MALLLISACAARHSLKQDVWIISQSRGLSFQVLGHGNTWYRMPQGDGAVKVGDTLYINYPGHEKQGMVTR